MTELVQAPEQPGALTTSTGVERMLMLALERGIDPAGLEKLLDMQERVRATQARQEYHEAMRRVQAQVPKIHKAAWNSHTKSTYVRLEDLITALAPIYTAHGFALSFGTEPCSNGPDWIAVTCTVSHIGGHTEHLSLPLALDASGSQGKSNKTGVQAAGSTIAYGRRYLTLMVFNVSTTDDVDGNADDAPVERPTEQQLADLRVLIEDSKSDVPALLKFAKVDALEDMDIPTFNRVCKAIQIKMSKGAK